MTAPADPSLAARVRALLDSAAGTDDPSLRFRVLLRRALQCDDLPKVIEFGVGGNADDVILGSGWGNETGEGRWTLGPVAQMLIVTARPLRGDTSLTIEIANAFVAERYPQQTVALAVNGVALGQRRFGHGEPFERGWAVVVPANVVELLDALLVDIRPHAPARPADLGLEPDFRFLGIMVRRVRVNAVSMAATDGVGPPM
jgi:hypothetical protein